jgi:hydrogenase expression/formation protein HypC
MMCLLIPLKVVAIDGPKAQVECQGERRKVDVSALSGIKAGDYILAHGDMATQKLGRKEALETLAILQEISEGQA